MTAETLRGTWPLLSAGTAGIWTAVGQITAMAGTALCLLLLVAAARLPWLESSVGHDRSIRFHRTVAPFAVALIVAHVAATTIGWAGSDPANSNPLTQFWAIITGYGWMMPALVGFLLLVGLSFASWKTVRRLMRYDTWWVAHLYLYLAIVLSFGHQLTTGALLTSDPLLYWVWITGFAVTAGLLLTFRWLRPLWHHWYHRITVSRVEPGPAGTYSVWLSGRDLPRLKAVGGQYFKWRFLSRGRWWQAHPYSLSADPRRGYRITVREVGDHSSWLATVRPGTRVIAEGPFGSFTARAWRGGPLLAVAAGIGITPVYAMLHTLPATATDVTVVWRTHDQDAPLRDELAALVKARGWTLLHLPGPRTNYPALDAGTLTAWCPHIAHADVFVCGTPDFTNAVVDATNTAGTSADHIHHENFAW